MARNITKSPNDTRAPGLAEFAKSNGKKIPFELIPEKKNISKSGKRKKEIGKLESSARGIATERVAACPVAQDAARG